MLETISERQQASGAFEEITRLWRPGDRFFYTAQPMPVWFANGERRPTRSRHAGRRGTYRGVVVTHDAPLIRHVSVVWDDPRYSPPGLGPHRLGLVDFRRYARRQPPVDCEDYG